MAINVYTPIAGNDVGLGASYCYLYEPFLIQITDSNATAKKIYINLVILDAYDSFSILETLIHYGEYDTYDGNLIEVDLMELVQQHHDANVYKFDTYQSIGGNNLKSDSAMTAPYVYYFQIISDVDSNITEIKKRPIIGGRSFKNYTPAVVVGAPLTEAELYGVDLSGRWKDYPHYSHTMIAANQSSPAARIQISTILSTTGKKPCGGMIIWKSRFGGWMCWGMDIKKENHKGKYIGDVETGMFESTSFQNGNPFIPTNYIGVDYSYSYSLKALSLTSNEMKAVAGINYSPAVYYLEDVTNSKIELMRVSSISTPLSNLAGGGDFSITLNSISSTGQKTR